MGRPNWTGAASLVKNGVVPQVRRGAARFRVQRAGDFDERSASITMTASKSRRRAVPRCWCRDQGRPPGRGRARCWSRSRRPASTAPTSCSARAPIRRRRAHPTFPASRSPARWSALGEGAARFRLGDRGLRPGAGRRLCANTAVVHETNALPRARRPLAGRGGRDARDVLHRLDQRVRARRAEGRRDLPGPWRLVRHRHHGDHAGQGLRRDGDRDGRV